VVWEPRSHPETAKMTTGMSSSAFFIPDHTIATGGLLLSIG
jgi:hypothetical protein